VHLVVERIEETLTNKRVESGESQSTKKERTCFVVESDSGYKRDLQLIPSDSCETEKHRHHTWMNKLGSSGNPVSCKDVCI
jgi:hypothetical protein